MKLERLKEWLSQYLNRKTYDAPSPEDSTEDLKNKEQTTVSMVELLVRNPVQPT
jgi:hypothetical protein